MRRLLILLALLAPLPAAALTRYAVPSGGASSGSCLLQSPGCTLQAAVNAAVCGDLVDVAAGVYSSGFTTSDRSCTQALPLVIKYSGPRSTATTGARIMNSSGVGVTINFSNYVTLEGVFIDVLGVSPQPGPGILLQGNSRGSPPTGLHNSLVNVEVRLATNPVNTGCVTGCQACGVPPYESSGLNAPEQDYLLVDGVIIGKPRNAECNMAEESTCMAMRDQRFTTVQRSTCYGLRNAGNFGNGEDIVFQDNVYYDMKNHGIGIIDATRVLIQRNVWYWTNNDRGISDTIWILCSNDVNVRNNLLIGFGPGGLTPTGQGVLTHANCGHEDNGVDHGPGSADPWPVPDPGYTTATNIKVHNNIFADLHFYASTGVAQSWTSGLTSAPFASDNNLYWNNEAVAQTGGTYYSTVAAWRGVAFLCPGGTPCHDFGSTDNLDPTFADELAHDYRPRDASSPQVNRGLNSNCAHAIVGGACDIGPFEFSASGADSTPPSGVGNVLPSNGATDVSVAPTLEAAAAAETQSLPVQYEFQLFQPSSGAACVAAGTCCSGAPTDPGYQTRAFDTVRTWQPSALQVSTLYAWRNRARDSVGNTSAYGACWTFTTRSQGTDIACTENAILDAIAEINANTRTTITFNCALQDDQGATGTSTIPLSSTGGNSRIICPVGSACASNPPTQVIVDGQGAGITLTMNPPWWDVSPTFCAGGADCDANADNIPELCPTVGDSGTTMWAFALQTAGVVRNLTYSNFMEGVRLEANGAGVDNVVCNYPGDDCASNFGGTNVTLNAVTANNACDKAFQFYGNETLNGGTTYDVDMTNSTINNAVQSLRTSGSGARGRMRFVGNTIRTLSPPHALYTQDGPRFGDDTTSGGGDPTAVVAIYWGNNTVSGTNRGMRVTGAARLISLGGNVWTGNLRRGLVCGLNSICIVQGDTFTNNGGGASTSDLGSPAFSGYGAVAVGNTAILNAGGGPAQTIDGSARTSTGGNTFTNNSSCATCGDTTLNFHNVTNPPTVQFATSNCWNDVDPGDEITPCTPVAGPNCSLVTYSPLNASCAPGICGNGSVEAGESCDDGSVAVNPCLYGDRPPLAQVCNGTCTGATNCASPQYCGDGTIQVLFEQCDGANMGGYTCASFGCAAGSPSCSSPPGGDTLGGCVATVAGCSSCNLVPAIDGGGCQGCVFP